MQKEWSSFRITAVLYVIVLLMPIGFYFVYNSFQTMKEDTKIIRQSSQLAGNIEHCSLNGVSPQRPSGQIDAAIADLSAWVKQNSHSEYYIGGATLLEDFQSVAQCWGNSKKSISTNENNAAKCYETADSLALTMEKMVYLKQNKIINIFYGSLFLTMALLLLAIYLMRGYIEQQLRKNSIYDLPTKLFNKNFFQAELKKSCSNAQRHDAPLSLLCVEATNFDDKGHDKKSKEDILKKIGGLLITLTRSSDIACHYDENHFVIILPGTALEGTAILEQRVKQALEDHNFGVYPALLFKTTSVQFDGTETPEALTKRALG